MFDVVVKVAGVLGFVLSAYLGIVQWRRKHAVRARVEVRSEDAIDPRTRDFGPVLIVRVRNEGERLLVIDHVQILREVGVLFETSEMLNGQKPRVAAYDMHEVKISWEAVKGWVFVDGPVRRIRAVVTLSTGEKVESDEFEVRDPYPRKVEFGVPYRVDRLPEDEGSRD